MGSVAVGGFYLFQVMLWPGEEASRRADAEAMPARGDLRLKLLRLKLLQCDVARLLDKREDQALVCVDARRPGIAAALVGSPTADFALPSPPIGSCLPQRRRNAPPPAPATRHSKQPPRRVPEDRAKGASSTCPPASFVSRQVESDQRIFGNPIRQENAPELGPINLLA